MVRPFVSVGVVLACGWSALSGVIQAGTLTLDSSTTTNVENGNQTYYNASNNWQNALNGAADYTPPPSIRDIVFTPVVTTPILPPAAPIPAPKDKLTSQRFNSAIVAGRRGAAVFQGVIEGNTERSAGYVRLVLSRTGRGSASISLGGSSKRVIIPVEMDEQGLLAPVGRGTSPSVSVIGTLSKFSDGSTGFDAVVTNDNQRTPVRMLKAAASAEVIEAVKGRYTMVFDNSSSGIMLYPGVTGFGTLQINKSGYISFSGRFSDGSSFSQGTQLNSAGKWAAYSTATNGATLSGNVSFADLSNSDCSGALQWHRQYNGRLLINQTANVSLRGSRYLAVLGFGGMTNWNFDARTGPGAYQASGSLTQPSNKPLRLASTGSDQTRLGLTKTSGKLSGTFIRSGNPYPQKAIGILFQKTNEGFGLTKPIPVRAASATLMVMPTWSGKFTLDGSGSATAN